MKIAVLLFSFLLIQTSISQTSRDDCKAAGIKDAFLPDSFPIDTPDTSGPCTTDNVCCTSDYITELRVNIQVQVFKKCIRASFQDILEIAEDFFDSFSNSFGNAARKALVSAFTSRAYIDDDTDQNAYIDNELYYTSQLLANLTFVRIRVDDVDNDVDNVNVKFRSALRKYACDYLASLIQKGVYSNTVDNGRIDGACICRLPDVGEKVDGLIDSIIEPFTNTIANIARLIRAIKAIEQASLDNLKAARDFEVSPLCTRQFINALACQHCQGEDKRTCPDSCRLVSLLCLQPLRAAFTEPYDYFIMLIRLAITSITGGNSNTDSGAFDLLDFRVTAGKLTKQLMNIKPEVAQILRESITAGQTLAGSDCFFTREKDEEDGTFKCQERDDSMLDCTREMGDREIVDVDKSDDDVDGSDNGDVRPDSGDSAAAPQKLTSESDERDEDLTPDEQYFVDNLKSLVGKFDSFNDFKKIFYIINSCLCRASIDTDGDEQRFASLLVSQPNENCFKTFNIDSSTDDYIEFDRNPAFLALSDVEKTEFEDFNDEVAKKFVNFEQVFAENSEASSTFEQLMGDPSSSAGRLLTSLFAIFSALLTMLFLVA